MPYQVWKCKVCHKECDTKSEAIQCEVQLRGIKFPLIQPRTLVYVKRDVIGVNPVFVKSVKLGPHINGLAGMHSVYLELETEVTIMGEYPDLNLFKTKEVSLDQVSLKPTVEG
jgi:hypothetical protein